MTPADWLTRAGRGSWRRSRSGVRRAAVGLGLAVGDQTFGWATDDPAALVAELDGAFRPRWVWWDRATADRWSTAACRSSAVGTCSRCIACCTADGAPRCPRRGRGCTTCRPTRCRRWASSTCSATTPTRATIPNSRFGPTGTSARSGRAADGRRRRSGWRRGPRSALEAAALQRQRLAERPQPDARAVDRPIGIGGRVPVRRAERWRVADRRRRGGSDHRRGGRAAPDRRRRRRSVAPPSATTRSRNTSGPDRASTCAIRATCERCCDGVGDRRPEHAGASARAVPRRASRGRRAADVAQGGTDRHHLRLSVARRARDRRAAARRVVEQRRCRRTDDRLGGAPQPAVGDAPGGGRRAGHACSCGPTWARSNRACWRRCRATAPSIAATREDDLYQPVAARLGVTREIAKVAVLGAMYGATTGDVCAGVGWTRTRLPDGDGHARDGSRIGPRRRRHLHRRRSAGADVGRRQHRRRPRPRPQRGRRPWAVRSQCVDPGRGCRVLQGVGGHRAGAGRGAGCRDRAVSCTTSCWCRLPPRSATPPLRC